MDQKYSYGLGLSSPSNVLFQGLKYCIIQTYIYVQSPDAMQLSIKLATFYTDSTTGLIIYVYVFTSIGIEKSSLG